MPSDSVTSFLDHARASRLILPDQVDDLIGRADVPQEGLAAVCDFLRDRGVLTEYQADLIRAGRAAELTFAGYPVVGELGPCPGGTAYRALHPSLRTPVVLRRLRPPEGGDPGAFARRAQAAAPVVHPHLAHLLDAGVHDGEPFAALEPFAGADLQTLVTDIGPMPAALAASYARQVAVALQAAHDRGLAHGGVRAAAVFVGPLVPMSKPRADGSTRFRPAPTATVKLFELGLVPRSDGEPTPADDVAALGATLHSLLTGRMLADGGPTLESLRPDVPAELVALVREMTATDPPVRPTAATAADRLARIVAPPAPLPPSPLVGEGRGGELEVPPTESPLNGDGTPELLLAPADDAAVTPGAETPPEEQPVSGGWVAVPYAGPTDPAAPEFTPPAFAEWPAEETAEAWAPTDAPARPRRTQEKGRRVWVWLAVGAGLQLLAILGWIYLFASPGCSSQTEPPPKAKK
jgi:hypothetical protein